MDIIYAEEPLGQINYGDTAVFLAGPSPRSGATVSWRPEAIQALEKAGFDGTILVPEPRDSQRPANYDDQIAWEWKALLTADVVAFWIPRDLKDMPGFTTNVEFGLLVESSVYEIILGYPKGAEKMRYLHWHADRCNVPVVHTLEDLAKSIVERR